MYEQTGQTHQAPARETFLARLDEGLRAELEAQEPPPGVAENLEPEDARC